MKEFGVAAFGKEMIQRDGALGVGKCFQFLVDANITADAVAVYSVLIVAIFGFVYPVSGVCPTLLCMRSFGLIA